MSSSIQTPLPVPARHGAPSPRKLSEKEQVAYVHVLAHFSNPDYVLPGVDNQKAVLMNEERMWLSHECILRFLRATRYDASKCIQHLVTTLKWRRDFGLYTHLTPEQVEAEAMTSHMFLYGYDTQNRPIIYYYPSKQTTQESERQIQFLFWTYERAIELMGPGVESITFMIDFSKAPSFYFVGKAVSIIQAHYPECVGVVVCARSPRLLSAFWDFVMPLLNEHMHSTLVFDSVTNEAGLWRTAKARDQGESNGMLASSDQLLSECFSGSVSFEYTHDVYWPALLAMCDDRKKALMQVWRQLGGVVGIKEWDVRIGVQDGLTATSAINKSDC